MYRYKEIYSDIKNNILTNHYRAGKPLPTQEILSEKYDVSRLTLKKALNLLLDEGLIVSRQGSGTYVRNRPLKKSDELLPLDMPIGVTYSHRDQKVTSKVIDFGARLPTEEESKNLSIKRNEPVYEIKRERFVNEKTYSYEHTIMPTSIVPLDEKIVAGSIYDFLGEHKVAMTDARRIVYAQGADEEIAQGLNIKVNDPVLTIEQIVFDQDGRAFEYSHSSFLSEKSKFVFDVHRTDQW
ncbi:GntR family transcriptional regulator [Companilactobacillus bobalius]|uniref:Transcriptional regulator n=2 Tax=Companilactobacillus bobalius TaxID=2801451 RepID=A0A0R1KD89_9LACO|nr:GntR family transcriptional regulator [Companilactobacillus bobalius]KAE9562555.1 GntR family transcriptional regulator [Companilactobacillus bobalius]KRK81551.1 transcriptional regulator [Companilactobacillus bobalius DSM 19674]OVE97623.1 putative HTH-type transcriptional regulator YurK [Companilactobacillus bobalius]GEO57764.1 GntR family transcriptional regulator [Companilactobacillus paralimentarius]